VYRVGGHDVHADQRQDLTYRFASAADLVQFYGWHPRATVKAVVILLDDEPVAVIGLELSKEGAKFFSDYSDRLKPHMKRIPVMRALKLAMTLVESCSRPVYAIDSGESDILVKLGFEHVQDEVYQWRR
jgi:hypothetical protein